MVDPYCELSRQDYFRLRRAIEKIDFEASVLPANRATRINKCLDLMLATLDQAMARPPEPWRLRAER